MIKIVRSRTLVRNLALTWLLLGIAWWALSFLVGVHSVTTSSGRQIGYLFALNWSVVYSLILPALIYMISDCICQSYCTAAELAERGMVYDGSDNGRRRPVGDAEILRALNDAMRYPMYVWLALTAIGLAYSLNEWYGTSAAPLRDYATEAEMVQAKVQLDWAVAAVLTGGSRVANGIFSALVFTFGQAAILSIGFLFLVFTITYGLFLHDLRPSGRGNLVVLPSLDGKDPRFGFEVFEEFSKSYAAAVLLIFSTVYLVILQNQFLDSGSNANIFTYLLRPYVRLDLQEVLEPISSGDISMVLAIPAILLVVLSFFGVIWYMLSSLAGDAKTAMRSLVEHGTIPGPRTASRVERAAEIEQMVTWPYNWLALNKMIVAVTLLIGGAIFYRLFVILFVLFLGFIVQAIVRELRSRANVAVAVDAVPDE